MRRYAVAIFIFLIGHFYGDIIESPHFKDIVAHATPETLIILDIDDTLIIPVQMLGCDEWFKFRIENHRAEGMNPSQALEKALSEWEAVRHLTKMEIVEPGTDTIVHSLQMQGYPIMGLTTQGLALATRTAQQLKQNHIDLSLTHPGEDCYFRIHGHGVLYRNGILFTSGSSKGESFQKLCEEIGYTPQRVIFINDKASHLEDIESVAQKMGIEFLGLRYAYSDKRKAAFLSHIAEFQFSHSTLDHLLSDEEARLRLTEMRTLR